LNRWIGTFSGKWRLTAIARMAAREISYGGPAMSAPPIESAAALGSSWVRGEMMATLENDLGSSPKEHIKLGWSQSIFPNTRLSCGQRCVAEAMDRLGAARLAHQTPRVKSNARLKAVNFLDVRCTKLTTLIIALCSLKVNPQDFKAPYLSSFSETSAQPQPQLPSPHSSLS